MWPRGTSTDVSTQGESLAPLKYHTCLNVLLSREIRNVWVLVNIIIRLQGPNLNVNVHPFRPMVLWKRTGFFYWSSRQNTV